MPVLPVTKIVGAPAAPATYEPNTLILSRIGDGFDLWLVNNDASGMVRANGTHEWLGSRAALDALAAGNGLLPGQTYVIMDEERIAVAFTSSSFRTFAPEAAAVTTPRPAISRTTIWGASAHSLLDAARGHIAGELDADSNAIPDHGGILIEDIWEATPASMPHTFLPFSSEADRYARNGPERTAPYTGPLAVALFGDAGTGQMWAPGSAEWTTQRDTLVLYATEALAAGRAYMILATPWPPSATSTAPFFEDISAKTQLLRDEIEAAVTGIDIWVFPEHLLVQYALATYGADVYGGDGLHLRRPDELPLRYTTWGLSRMLDQFLTQQEWDTTGGPAELADLTAEAWNIITTHEWCGMGGATVITPAAGP